MTLPLNGHSHDVLTHLSIPDRPFLNRTAKELCLIVGGIAGGLGALGQRGLPLPLALGEAAAIVVACVTLAVYRPHDRSLAVWVRLAVLYASSPRLLAWRPPLPMAAPVPSPERARPPYLAALGVLPQATAPDPAARVVPGTGKAAAARRSGTQDEPFVPSSIDDGVVTFADGSRCAVLECGGRNTALMDAAGRQALHVGFHGFLMGLTCPIKFLTSATPADMRAYAAVRTGRLTGLPPGLRVLESADTAYMGRVVKRRNMLDHHTYAIVPLAESVRAPRAAAPPGPFARFGRGQAPPDAPGPLSARDAHQLDEQCERVTADLVPAGVDAWRLDTATLMRVWHTLLNPRSSLAQPLPASPATPLARPTILFETPTEERA